MFIISSREIKDGICRRLIDPLERAEGPWSCIQDYRMEENFGKEDSIRRCPKLVLG